RNRRRGRAVRRRRQATGRVLRGARQRRLAGARIGRALRVRGGAARDRGREARGHRPHGARAPRRPPPAPRVPPPPPPPAPRLTANPYPGTASRAPSPSPCRNHGAGLFCLVRTSNAGGRDIQEATLSDGTPLWRHVAGLVDEWGADFVGERGMSSVGAVVGAT